MSACPTCAEVVRQRTVRNDLAADPVLPGGISVVEVIFSGGYRDQWGDNCDLRESLCKCDTCGQLYRHIVDTDMQMLSWTVRETLTPISDVQAGEMRKTKGKSRDEPYDP